MIAVGRYRPSATWVSPERERELVARYLAGAELEPDLGPPIVERCGFCSFVVKAPLADARAAFAEHDCPRPRPPLGRRRPGFQIRH